MKEGYTHITMLLDRSGSMYSIKLDTIGSFNEFIEKQKEIKGECTFSLIQFDDKYDIVYNFVDIKEVPNLDVNTFVPRGATALIDAIGRTINTLGEKFSNMEENERAERVIFVILTDGLENDSKEFKKEQINKMIAKQNKEYNWQFIFLGADQNAIDEGRDYGIKSGNSMTFAKSSEGVGSTMSLVGNYISNTRRISSKKYKNHLNSDIFTEEDREKQGKYIKDQNADNKE